MSAGVKPVVETVRERLRRVALANLDMSKRDLAERFNINENTVARILEEQPRVVLNNNRRK